MRSRPKSTLLAAAAAALLVALVAGCGSSNSSAGGVTVRQATIDKPANPQQGAMRFVIANDSDVDDALTGASSPMAERASIHRTTEDAEGRSSMEMVKELRIPAGGEVTFDPGTYHVMLEGFERPLRVGDEVPVTFTFEQAGKKKVMAKVIEAGDAEMDDSTHTGRDHG